MVSIGHSFDHTTATNTGYSSATTAHDVFVVIVVVVITGASVYNEVLENGAHALVPYFSEILPNGARELVTLSPMRYYIMVMVHVNWCHYLQ